MNSHPHLTLATSTMADGNMSFRHGAQNDVVANRTRFLTSLGIPFRQQVCMTCDHGDVIRVVPSPTQNPAGFGATNADEQLSAEALLTAEPDVALLLQTADCIPAVFHDPEHNAVALAHLNRHTIAHDLSTAVIKKMQAAFNTDPRTLQVYFGPHIKKESYVYPLPLRDTTPSPLAPFITEHDGVAAIDMTTAFAERLMALGVASENLTISPIDTGSDPNYFSHYRNNHSGEPTGRMITAVVLRS